MSLLLKKLNMLDPDDDVWTRAMMLGLPTGFTGFDIMTSTIEKDIYRERNRLNGGLFPQVYTFTGESGTGKTTLIIQLVGGAINNMLSLYNGISDAEFIFFDNEGFSQLARISALTGWTDKEMSERLYLDKEKFSPSQIYNIIRKIADTKEKNSKDLTFETGMSTLVNEAHKTMIPTYVVIDSVANMSEIGEFEHSKDGELKDDVLFSNTDGMRDSRNNTNFLKKIKPLLVKYNIAVIMVNHIVPSPSLDLYAQKNRALPWLASDKKLKGGEQMVFQTAFLPRLKYMRDHSNDKNQVYGERITGQINTVEFWKNKNGPEGVKYPLVFDSRLGYIPEISDFEFLLGKNYGISGTSSYTLDILPEVKISRKILLDLCESNPIVARAIQFTAKMFMIYSWVKHDNPIDLTEFQALSLKDRLQLIYSFTSDYPRYKVEGMKIKKEHFDDILNSKLQFGDTTLKYFDSYAKDTIKNYKNGYSRWLGRITIEDARIALKRNPKTKYIYRQKSN